MFKAISTLFQERAHLVVKQMNLAKNLQSEYVSKEVPFHLRDYNSLAELQNKIGLKEKQIVNSIRKRTTANELNFMHINQK